MGVRLFSRARRLFVASIDLALDGPLASPGCLGLVSKALGRSGGLSIFCAWKTLPLCVLPEWERCREGSVPNGENLQSAAETCGNAIWNQVPSGPISQMRLIFLGSETEMAKKRKYSRSAGKDVEREMHRYKRGKAKSGRGGKGGKVKSRKQAIAIGLSKARKKGKKVPRKKR
jgi:hypothetical protein